MTPEFTPYTGEGQQTSRDILNTVRELIWHRDRAMNVKQYVLAAGYFTLARNKALIYIASAGHGDINTIHRLARLVAPPASYSHAIEITPDSEEEVLSVFTGAGPPPAAGATSVEIMGDQRNGLKYPDSDQSPEARISRGQEPIRPARYKRKLSLVEVVAKLADELGGYGVENQQEILNGDFTNVAPEDVEVFTEAIAKAKQSQIPSGVSIQMHHPVPGQNVDLAARAARAAIETEALRKR